MLSIGFTLRYIATLCAIGVLFVLKKQALPAGRSCLVLAPCHSCFLTSITTLDWFFNIKYKLLNYDCCFRIWVENVIYLQNSIFRSHNSHISLTSNWQEWHRTLTRKFMQESQLRAQLNYTRPYHPVTTLISLSGEYRKHVYRFILLLWSAMLHSHAIVLMPVTHSYTCWLHPSWKLASAIICRFSRSIATIQLR